VLARPTGPVVEKFRTSEADDRDRRLPRPFNYVFDEVKQRWLCPVNVLEHEEKRPLLGERLEELAIGPEDLLRALCLLGIGRSGGTLWQAAEDLLQRPKRDALPVGEAAPLKDRRAHSHLTN
jgi:hypothetical protein